MLVLELRGGRLARVLLAEVDVPRQLHVARGEVDLQVACGAHDLDLQPLLSEPCSRLL